MVNETAAIDVWRLRWYNFYIRTHISAGGEVQPPFLEASKSNDDKLIVSHEEEENHHPFMGSLFSAIN